MRTALLQFHKQPTRKLSLICNIFSRTITILKVKFLILNQNLLLSKLPKIQKKIKLNRSLQVQSSIRSLPLRLPHKRHLYRVYFHYQSLVRRASQEPGHSESTEYLPLRAYQRRSSQYHCNP